jgi:alpha-tubulin suppressor-like RCC1 family protein
MFVKTDGTLWAMGYNNYGQLGDGTTTNRSTPAQVATGVAQVAAGSSHTLFVKTDGTLEATGSNGSGQLGDGTTTNRSTPVQVATGVAQVADQVAAGSSHSVWVIAVP